MTGQKSRLFDVYLAVDWSARSVPSPVKPVPDTIWVGETFAPELVETSGETYWRTRLSCLDYLKTRLSYHIALNRRILIGFDIPYGYSQGFAASLGLNSPKKPWRNLWNELTRLIEDAADNSNNRFQVAAELNARCEAENLAGPLCGCPVGLTIPHLTPTSPPFPFLTRQGFQLERLRWTDKRLRGVQPVWKLMGTGSVGSQGLMGIPIVARLRDDPSLAPVSRVWPFETGFSTESFPQNGPFILHTEIWPGVVRDQLDPAVPIRDQAQVRAVVNWLARLDRENQLDKLFETPANLIQEAIQACIEEEGWTLGAI